MKKIVKLIFASAALLAAFVSCQRVEEISEAPKTTHTVKFTTEMPTKTSYEVDGSTVKYKWEESDLNRLHVYEDGVEGTIIVDESAIAIEETYVMLTVSFEGEDGNSHTYTANLNGGVVKSEQVADGKYDSDCDVLVAKPISSGEITDGIYTFQFRRPVAITDLKLRNLKAGEEVGKVTIFSDANHPLTGTYTQGTTDHTVGEWGETSNKIVVTFGTDGETLKTKTVEDDGSLIVPIVSMPVESASVKVLVETESGLKYRKVTASALTLIENNVKVQGIGLTPVSEAEHAEDGWYLVTDASELFDGDEIRIASPAKGMIAGEFAVVSEETKEYLVANSATFTPGTYAQITGVDSENRPNTFTLVENYGSFALVNENGKLGTTNTKKMSYDDGTGSYSGVTDWTIAIADNLATISAGDYGRILCNVTDTRFLNYTSNTSISMLLPQIYKKYGDASDPIIKKARTASFSPESATVTIDANDNVFPSLSFEPTEATEGAQTWTSSNTEVATVNATTGEVTLVSDGTTTISVEIGESETYQPCSASYELTVKPAPVQGLDIIDNDFVGNPNGYTKWNDKVATNGSGNTYAGESTTQSGKNNIQMRATKPSGIVVTKSGSGKVARKITVKWNSETANDKTIDVYGKDSAYSSEDGASDLYDNSTDGDKLGSIVYGTSTELEIEGDYEFIGLRSNSGALYVESITIQWEDPKPKYEACFKDAGGNEVKEINATFGSVFTAPVLYNGTTSCFADTYESSNIDVATVNKAGIVTLKKKGDAIITATLNGDDTHKTTKVSYTLHVANVLSSIKLAEDSEQSTIFYVGKDFSFEGIKLEAEYNDGEKKTLTADDLSTDNFSGFDSSAAVESQTITVSYNDGATRTTTYNVEIRPLVTLYGITVPAEDANGNSITVKGGLTEAPEGGEIELNVNLNNEKGYKLTSLKVNDVEHSTDVAEGKYTFTMPAEAVTVTAEFDNHYTVTLTQLAANGTVKVRGETTSPQSIACGETVSVLAEPETGYELDSWTINGAELADATKASTTFTMPAKDVSVTASFKVQVASVHDILTNLDLAATSSSYADFTNVKKNTAVYAGQSSKNYGIQLRAANPSGIVSTTSGGKIKTVSVKWNSNCIAGRTLDVYGKNSAYSNAADLYNSTNQGTKIGSIVQGKSTILTISGDYTYVGVRSNNGALNIDKIDFEWGEGGTPTPTTYTLTLTQVTGGTISAEVGGQSVPTGAKIEEGKTVTIKAQASSGYSFTSWVLPTSGLASSTETTTTFTMTADTEVKANFTSTGSGGTTTWTRCTSVADLTSGGTFIIGYEATAKSGKIISMSKTGGSASTTAAGYMGKSDSEIDMATVTATSDYEFTIVASSNVTGAVCIKWGDNYIGNTNTKNNLKLFEEESETTAFGVTVGDNDVFTFKIAANKDYHTLQYNSSSPRFAVYGGTQKNLVVYKKSN